MKFFSERGGGKPVTFLQAVLAGLAADGGLYVPETLPKHRVPYHGRYAYFVNQLLQPFVDDMLPLTTLCERAFDFPVPLKLFAKNQGILELFYGPSLSFKDFGARFLAQIMPYCPAEKQRLIMVATSGDTGSAVAAAFHQQSNVRVAILYPKGKVSARQAHQLACWGDNVTTFAVQGSFDHCQALVKQAFASSLIGEQFHLTTANSINIGRLLPQIGYYAYSSLKILADTGLPTNIIVPSGNLGNVTAAFWARAMGYPINKIVLAQNTNASVVNYLASGHYQPEPSIETLANAMDVGAPSNLARLQHLYPQFAQFKEQVSAYKVSDAEIKQAIVTAYHEYGLRLCPHTATAYHVWQHVADHNKPWLLVATADPAKFANIVEPLLQIDLPLSDNFRDQLSRPIKQIEIAPNLSAVLAAI